MARRQFSVSLDVLIEVDDALLVDVLTDEWRAQFYPLRTPADVAGHLARNLVRGSSLGDLDGFADQPPERAQVVEIDCDDVVEDDHRNDAVGTLGLSPRSVSCLRAVGIRTVGELAMRTVLDLRRMPGVGPASVRQIVARLRSVDLALATVESVHVELRRRSVDTLDLSVRAANCLQRAEIRTVGQLMDRLAGGVCQIEHANAASVEEFRAELRGLGLAVPGERKRRTRGRPRKPGGRRRPC